MKTPRVGIIGIGQSAFKPKRDGEDGNNPAPAKTEPAAAEGH